MRTLPPYFLGDTVYCYVDTYSSAGASVTITGLAVTDIEVYKNGSMTQRASDNGFTLLDTDGIDLDGSTGLHGFSIDTSDNSDAGFWVAGQYCIHVNAITVDSQTVKFSYDLKLWPVTRGLCGTSVPAAASDAAGGLPVSDAGGLDLDTLLGYLTAAVATAAELAKVPKSDGSASWNATALAAIQSECNDALVAYDPPTKAEQDAAFTELKGATWSAASDTLEHIRDKETDIEADTQDLQTQVGTAGAGLTAVPWNAAWDAEVQSEAADALNAYDPPTKAELDAAQAAVTATGIDATTANKIADHVLRRSQASARASSDGEAVTFRSLLGASSKLTNKVQVSGTDLLVKEENDSTTFGTQAITSDAAADPIVALDTA